MRTTPQALTEVVLALGGVAVLVLLAIAVTSGVSDEFDRSLIQAIREPEFREVLAPLRMVTELGSTGAVTALAVLTVLVGVLIGPWLHGLIGAIIIGLASFANSALKLAVARVRPDLLEPIVEERGFSFPSGHSALGMVAWGILAVLVTRSRLPLGLRRTIVVASGTLIFLIGLSRVWLGVHYPTDVLAGWTAGAVIVLVFARLTRRVSPAPAAAAVDVDPATRRSDPPAAG
jgi:undecaprenyl-diphosphatase